MEVGHRKGFGTRTQQEASSVGPFMGSSVHHPRLLAPLSSSLPPLLLPLFSFFQSAEYSPWQPCSLLAHLQTELYKLKADPVDVTFTQEGLP